MKYSSNKKKRKMCSKETTQKRWKWCVKYAWLRSSVRPRGWVVCPRPVTARRALPRPATTTKTILDAVLPCKKRNLVVSDLIVFPRREVHFLFHILWSNILITGRTSLTIWKKTVGKKGLDGVGRKLLCDYFLHLVSIQLFHDDIYRGLFILFSCWNIVAHVKAVTDQRRHQVFFLFYLWRYR